MDESFRQRQRARRSVLVAKWAYQSGHQRWLCLWAQALADAECCPAEERQALIASLCAFHPSGVSLSDEARSHQDMPTPLPLARRVSIDTQG